MIMRITAHVTYPHIAASVHVRSFRMPVDAMFQRRHVAGARTMFGNVSSTEFAHRSAVAALVSMLRNCNHTREQHR